MNAMTPQEINEQTHRRLRREARQPASARMTRAELEASHARLLAACYRILRAIEWTLPSDRLTATEQADILIAAIRAAEGGGK